MTESEWHNDSEISFIALGTTLLRQWRRLVAWVIIGTLVAVIPALFRSRVYTASASFMPQGGDVSRSGLANLAGQFGVALPTGENPSQSPDFYSRLLKSRELLGSIARDTFVVSEKGGKRIAFLDLFKIKGDSLKPREEKAVKKLGQIVSTSVVKSTGVLELSVGTEWPSVSLAITSALLDAVNEFNQRTRKSQAAAERKFVEGRLDAASTELRAAEDRLVGFMTTNKQFSSSPLLTFERERLQREVATRQQLVSTLTQSYEEVRIREVRDTPVITVIETPSVASVPEPRGLLKSVLVGILLGGVFGALQIFLASSFARRRESGDREAAELVGTLSQIKTELLTPRQWLRTRGGT